MNILPAVSVPKVATLQEDSSHQQKLPQGSVLDALPVCMLLGVQIRPPTQTGAKLVQQARLTKMEMHGPNAPTALWARWQHKLQGVQCLSELVNARRARLAGSMRTVTQLLIALIALLEPMHCRAQVQMDALNVGPDHTITICNHRHFVNIARQVRTAL